MMKSESRLRSSLTAAGLLLVALTTAGCGYKGDLFLEKDAPETQQSEVDPAEEDGKPEQ